MTVHLPSGGSPAGYEHLSAATSPGVGEFVEFDKAKLFSQDAEVGSGFWEVFGFQIFDQLLAFEHDSIDHVLGF